MENTNPSPNTFYIGLCLAGAVSAGAYTAGVIDYLIQALQDWQKRKDNKEPGTPMHDVVIHIIGGASAGGMTGLITAAALQQPIVPVQQPPKDLLDNIPASRLYHTWVDLLGKDMFPMMLKTNDINSGDIISLLNSAFIDQLAERALKVDADHVQPMPAFIDPELKVFTTLTNLQGFGYNISFNAVKEDKYFMAIHNDYACFKVNGDGKVEDGWMPLDFKKDLNIKIAKEAAMATGAFPIGLKSREVTRISSHVNLIPFNRFITTNFPVDPPDCKTLNVDGGVINNEPFDKVRMVLNEKTGQTDDQCQEVTTFKSTILMVDPFPSEKPGPFKANQKLFQVAGATFSAMLQQMRAKPVQLNKGMSKTQVGQYLIAPTRRMPSNNQKEKGIDIAGDKAIACGGFEGFSGFMSKEFRVHDYFLGRFNCEMFLRNFFTVPKEALEENPIFREGYKDTDASRFSYTDADNRVGYQIIPVFTDKQEGYFPLPVFSNNTNWPTITEETVEAFRPKVHERVHSLILNAVKVSGINKLLLWIGAKILLTRMLTNSAMNTIKEALQKHHLLD